MPSAGDININIYVIERNYSWKYVCRLQLAKSKLFFHRGATICNIRVLRKHGSTYIFTHILRRLEKISTIIRILLDSFYRLIFPLCHSFATYIFCQIGLTFILQVAALTALTHFLEHPERTECAPGLTWHHQDPTKAQPGSTWAAGIKWIKGNKMNRSE